MAEKAKSSRDRILEAYIELAYEIGIPNITLQKIADEAGVAFGTVRYYFSSEEGEIIHKAAFQTALAHSFREVANITAKLRTKKNANPVFVYVESMFDWVQQFPAYGSFLIYYYYLSSSKLRPSTELGDVNVKARQRIEALLFESIGMGFFKSVKNVKEAANAIHSSVVGHGFIAMVTGNKASFDLQREICKETINSYLMKG